LGATIFEIHEFNPASLGYIVDSRFLNQLIELAQGYIRLICATVAIVCEYGRFNRLDILYPFHFEVNSTVG